MRYLSGREVLLMHARIVDETGGAHGVRDNGLLQSALERPRMTVAGKDAYRTVHEKAAAYVDSIARRHAFVDGNKRTAVVAAARFLFLNGYELTATNEEVEAFVLDVAVGKRDLPEAAAWLKMHTRNMRAKR